MESEKMMKWLEIIELRTASNAVQDLQQVLQDLVLEVNQDLEDPKMRIYQSYAVASDYSIHLIHGEFDPNATGSVLGMRISDSLKNYGLVNHHVWCEMNSNLVAKEL